MKLKCGDMLIMDEGNGTLKLQIIGRDDVPRVEKEGRGWRDGATALLKGADVAEFLNALSNNISGEYAVGESGLSMKVEYNKLTASVLDTPLLVLSAKGVSAKLTWSERTMLVWAVRGFAWRIFM